MEGLRDGRKVSCESKTRAIEPKRLFRPQSRAGLQWSVWPQALVPTRTTWASARGRCPDEIQQEGCPIPARDYNFGWRVGYTSDCHFPRKEWSHRTRDWTGHLRDESGRQ